MLKVTGVAGKFDIIPLFIKIGAGLGLMYVLLNIFIVKYYRILQNSFHFNDLINLLFN